MTEPDWRFAIAVAAGAALGSVLRFAIASLSVAALGDWFPFGTLMANVVGSFLIAFVARRLVQPGGERAAAFWLAGFCGGLTTFSVFTLETVLFVEAGRAGGALLYVAASLCLWLGSAAAGWALSGRRNGG